MTGTAKQRYARRWLPRTGAALLAVLASAVALAAGCGAPASNDRGGQLSGPPDVAGTWMGAFESGGETGRFLLALEQEGERLTGHANLAGGGEAVYFDPLSGEATRPDGSGARVSLARPDEGEGVVRVEATVEGTDSMSGEVRGEEGDPISFDLERADLSTAEGMALATLQALHDQDMLWIAEHADLEWREASGTDTTEELAEDTTDKFIYATQDGEYSPPAGAEVSLVEETLTVSEGTDPFVRCEYETSAGGGGTALVALTEAGTASSGHRFLLHIIELEYEKDGVPQSVTLGIGNT